MNSYHIGGVIGNFLGNLILWWIVDGFFHGMCVGILAALLYVVAVFALEKWRNYLHGKRYAQPTWIKISWRK